MNSTSVQAPKDGTAGGNSTIDISRSGRVRKKNTLLAGFESLDEYEKPKRKSEKTSKKDSPVPAKVTLKIGETPKKVAAKKPPPKRAKLAPKVDLLMEPRLDLIEDEEGDLEIDLPPEFEGEMPMLAAEEIIDEGLLDEEDGATELCDNISINRLKSQAQSTYMMERSAEKLRKSLHQPLTSMKDSKSSKPRKDKGNTRITAYMLWSKEQRIDFVKKFPHMDFATISKKLGELWSTVSPNQKKMWKNKAFKQMKKNSNEFENIKNSANNANKLPSTVPTPLPGPTGKKVKKVPSISTLPNKAPNGGGKLKVVPKGISPKHAKKPEPSEIKSKNSFPQNIRGKKPIGKSLKVIGPNSGNSMSPKISSLEFAHHTNVHINDRSIKSNSLGMSNNVNVSTMQAMTVKDILDSPSSKLMQLSPKKDDETGLYKVTGVAPIDVAAHFSLLGESLTIIGERLKEREGQTVSGSLSVLLDSLLCATGPLLCLTQQIPELNCIPQENLANILDNIAYIMPGL